MGVETICRFDPVQVSRDTGLIQSRTVVAKHNQLRLCAYGGLEIRPIEASAQMKPSLNDAGMNFTVWIGSEGWQ